MKPWADPNNLNTDCRWFQGHIPCRPHKQFGVHCVDEQGRPCEHYDRLTSRILIIKLGAIGDVIRTTPLLRKLTAVYPHAQIWWLTYTPEVLPTAVDVALSYTPQALASLAAVPFDLLINLDKDREACALAAEHGISLLDSFDNVAIGLGNLDHEAYGRVLGQVSEFLSRAVGRHVDFRAVFVRGVSHEGTIGFVARDRGEDTDVFLHGHLLHLGQHALPSFLKVSKFFLIIFMLLGK